MQNEENSKYTERVRKQVASQAQRQQRAAPPPVLEDDDDAEASGAAASAAVAGDNGEALPAAPAGVRPPDRWGDNHMNWRHPHTFVFLLNGPLTYWHPHAGSRIVCDFLKKSPRSGPQDSVRSVSRNDSRREQRRGNREDALSESASRQGDIVASLRDSREAMASAAQEANRLTRLQLQFQVAQHASVNSTAHLVAAQTALNIVTTSIPAGSLDSAQAKKKRRLEKSLAKACLAVSVVPPSNPFASILADLSSPSFRCVCAGFSAFFTAHAHICRMMPIISSDAQTVPRSSSRGDGGAARPGSQNLHPHFDAAAVGAARSAAAD